ncbi:GDSL-like Lipase/Acylhydrolase [Chitinophaga sp. YR627]|uniref:GDSL-type esterase/lipase family protein n=1 Tax=Chitinophaga sp. YR627 TaxID=1881041 RepID=UPI0008EC75C7|nr:GDSL-type esterase/lipase family protein [Chitinophaga sp. YR627]SFN97036.1 GDSL-like Lipase/Acylhydrolase [Chitinophaga sp. YR627]
MNISSWNASKKGIISLFTGVLTTISSVVAGQSNTIAQDTALYRFFKALHHADSNVVSVLHLGDSHIQAGFFPFTTAFFLQQDFGSAGRGWVFPYNLANTNGPSDYRWNSTGKWDVDRIIDRNKSTDILGPGAIVLTSRNEAPALAYNGREDDEKMDNNIRQAELFYDAGANDAPVTIPGAGVDISATPFEGAGTTLRKASVTFPDAVQSFQVRWDRQNTQPFRFYGALLQNGHNGVLYSAVGINGAMFQHYNDNNNTLISEMEVMQPQLVVISLGTNEAYGALNAQAFRTQMDDAVKMIRKYQPNACIVMTTPPECKRVSKKAFRKKVGKKYKTYYRIAYYPNPYIAVVTQQMMSYCRENGLACWNFNAVNKMMVKAFAGGWSGDHIHFNARGYQLQGKLLYEALRNSYDKYLKVEKTHKNIAE